MLTTNTSIDHPPNSHDDLINAAAGALIKAFGQGNQVFPDLAEAIHNLDRYANPADEPHWERFHAPLMKVSALSHSVTVTAFLQAGIDAIGNVYALDECYQANKLISENALAIRNLTALYGKQTATYLYLEEESQSDTERFSVFSAYSREQVSTVPARKTATEVGLDLIKEHLRIDPGKRNRFTQEPGSPRLFISRQRCPNLWREMTGLKLEEADGRVKYLGATHAINCLRAIVMAKPKYEQKSSGVEPQRHTSAWA